MLVFVLLLRAVGVLAVKEHVGAPCAGAAAIVNFGCKNATKGGMINFAQLCYKEAFLQTVGHCINEFSLNNHNIRLAAYEYLSDTCELRAKRVISSSQLIQLTNQDPNVTTMFSPKDTSVQTKPVLLPHDQVEYNIGIREGQIRFSNLTKYFGATIVAYYAVIMLLVAILNYLPLFYMPSSPIYLHLQRRIFMSPTFSYHHSTPIQAGPIKINIPTRAVNIIICTDIALNVAFLGIGYQYKLPNYSAPSLSQQAAKQLAERAGFMAASHLPMLILFSGRNNWLLWITGLPLEVFLILHRWIARLMILELITHATCYTISRIQTGRLHKSWHAKFWILGFCALLAAGLILVQSLAVMRRRSYEIFRWMHIMLAAVFVGCAWHHLQLVEEAQQYIYTAVAFWAFDRLLRTLRTIYVSQTSTHCLGLRVKAKVYPDNVIEFEILNSRCKVHPGSFGYLIAGHKPWESHPFSLLESPNKYEANDHRSLFMFSRVKQGITKKFQAYIQKFEDGTCILPFYLEGPYGHRVPLELYSRVLLVCGGIGITGIYSYARYLTDHYPDIDLKLIWYIRDAAPLEWFGQHLASLDKTRVNIYIKMHVDNTDDKNNNTNEQEKAVETLKLKLNFGRDVIVSNSAVDVRQVVGNEVEGYTRDSTIKPMGILCCGPARMNDDVRSYVAKSRTKKRVDYYEESFSW